MAIYITQIEKHRFVCGLFWQSLSRPRELVREARDLAKKIDSDLFVLRKDQSTAQAGFAHTRDGVRRGVFSLGAVVSKTLAVEGAYYDGEQQPVHNWLAAFKLPDGRWAYFAVRDANFLPNGDFAGTKEEVLERLHGDYGLGGWNVVIGDAELAEYGFHNFNAKRIEDLIPRKKDGTIRTYGWWAMNQVSARVPWRAVAIASVAVLAVAVAGISYWQHYQKKQEDLRRDAAIEAARQKMLGAAPSTVPWAATPMPQAMARACVEKLRYFTPGGWSLDEYQCTPNQAIHSWSRHDSTIAFLHEQVPGAEVDVSGEKASFSESLKIDTGKAEAIVGKQELLEPLLSELQLMGVSGASSKLSKAPPPPAPRGNGQPAPQPDWQKYSFTLSAQGIGPMEVAAVLNRPGVRIQKMLYRHGEWSIEGVMYAK
jgi:hypothetical protein